MEDIVSNLKHCYTLQFDNDTFNNNSKNNSLDIGPLVRFPYVIYNKVNETHFQWCGPMFVIVQYLSKFTR